jgi:signal transduction histidine kinase
MGRLSLLWKILLSTSIAITALLAVTGWFVQDQMVASMSQNLEEEMRVSSQAYDSLWRSRASLLRTVSLVISSMSDVRAAFRTQDQATIRDTAGELWTRISVTDPQGAVIASLGGRYEMGSQIPAVRQASQKFPAQTEGFVLQDGHLYQMVVTPVYVEAGTGRGLLNVLVAGFPVDRSVTQELKERTGGSEFLFVVKGHTIASTLPAKITTELPAVAAGGVRLLKIGGNDYAVIRSDLHDMLGQPLGDLLIMRSFEAAQQKLGRVQRNLLLTWIAAVLAGLALSYWLARRVLQPIKELDRAAAQIAQQNYLTRVPLAGDDELGRLGQTFNAMCRSIQEAREELIRSERIATIGRLSSSIVHDLRNPLAAIYGGSELLMDGDWNESQVKRLASNIYRSSRAIKDMLQELTEVSRGRIQPVETCSLKEVITVAVEAHAAAADSQAVDIRLRVPDHLELLMERARMERVFVNLIGNALEAMPDGGMIEIEAVAEVDHVLVSVEDSGPGVALAIRQTLFQPFATSGKKNGLGLGLALSRQTVLDHGGDIWMDEACERGARFLVRLPT